MNENTQKYQKRLRDVLLHIESNLDSPPSLNALSRIACFSPYHFHRIFTAVMGETVAAYIRRLLLQRAAQQILTSHVSITTVAFDAGYDSLDAFTRAFRQMFGMTPSAYRKTAGGGVFSRTHAAEPCFPPFNTEEFPAVKIEIRKFAPKLAATSRHVGSYFECGPVWERLCQAVGSRNLIDANTMFLSMCWDSPDITPPEKCRMDIFLTLPDGLTEQAPEAVDLLKQDGIYIQSVGSDVFDYGVATIKGPYTLLADAYRYLYGEWLPQSGREPADLPSLEIYRNDPGSTPPEELLTEIYLPLLPKTS